MLSLEFYKKLNWVFGVLAIGVLFALIAFAATIEIKDLDLWLHIQMGQFIVQNGYVPSVDVLSASFAGQPWINHEWLFQIIVYLVKSHWGLDGLIYMQSAVVVLSFLIFLLLTYTKERQLAIIPLLFLVLQVYETRFTIRPDIFSVLFFALYIYILSLYLDKRWSLWVFFILQVIWSNMHGYSLFGIAFIAIGLTAEWLKRHAPLPYEWNKEGRLSDTEYQRLGWIFLVLILATLINPLTFQGALYPFKVLLGVSGDSKIFFQYITELKQPLHWNNLMDLSDNGPFKILIFLSFLSFYFNRRKVDISAILCWLVFLLFSLTAIRNMIYFAFAAFLVTMLNLSNLSLKDILPFKFNRQEFLHVTGWMLSIFMIAKLVEFGQGLSLNGYYDFDKYERKSEYLGVGQRLFPDKAVDFLVRNNIRGNFFNDYNSGAYLIGRVYPQIRVYMDGRTELRGGKFFKYYYTIWGEGNEKAFDQAVRRYNLTGVFVNTSINPAPSKLLKMIYAKKEWRMVYFDYDAVIFLKDIPENAGIIAKFAVDLSQSKPQELDLLRSGTAKFVPYRYLNRAQTLGALGFDEQAAAEADAALRAVPAYDLAFKIKGDYYSKIKDHEKAFINYRLALMGSPDNMEARDAFIASYIDLGRYARAVEEAKKAMQMAPDDPGAIFLLSKAYVKNKQYKEGYDILMQVLSKKPKTLDDFLKAGDVFVEEGALKFAADVFGTATNYDGGSAPAFIKLGDTFEKLGNKDQALVAWKKALQLSPGNKDLEEKISRVSSEVAQNKV
jgi:tetratricopeptide (TPR) repeat protein